MHIVFELASKIGVAGNHLIREGGHNEDYLMPALLAFAAACVIAKAGTSDRVERGEEIAHRTFSEMLNHYKAIKFKH
jgi:hypothetical protein